jgi:dihydrolipoamide dehydrogenase
MALSSPPSSLVVLGEGRFSIEWADLLASAGSRVTVVSSGDRILPDEDPDMASFLQILLEERNVRFILEAEVEDASGAPLVVAGEKLEADAVLTADARKPNVEDLNLEAAGLAVGPGGEIVVDAGCRTSVEGVFAAGDVTGEPWLSNRASAQGEVAAINATGGSAKVRPERIPRSVNTHPELAAVGLTEEQAWARGAQVGLRIADLATSMRAATLGDPRGALKLVVDEEFGEILGGHMVGVGAIEVIGQVAAAIEAEIDYRDLAKAHHIHPSMAELVAQAAGGES